MKKPLYIAAWITILVALGIMLQVIFWLVYPYKIADFTNLPFPIVNENKIVERGGHARYLMKYCKYVDTIPSVRKFLYNDILFEITNTVGVATKGCKETIAEAYISRNMPTGKYYIKIIATYKVNPVRNIQIVNTTEEFEIIE